MNLLLEPALTDAPNLFPLILLHEKFLQFDWLRAVVFQLNLKYLRENYKPFVGSSISN